MVDVIFTGLAMFAVSLFSATAGLVLLKNFLSLERVPNRLAADGSSEKYVYIFDDADLVDSTDAAQRMLRSGTTAQNDFDRFLLTFEPRFPALATKIAHILEGSHLVLQTAASDSAGLTLKASRRGSLLRVVLSEDVHETLSAPPQLNALDPELQVLRNVAETSPVLTWQQLEDDSVVWANAAYMRAVQAEFPDDPQTAWPPRCLFPGLGKQDADAPQDTPQRISLRSSTQSTQWLDLYAHPSQSGTLCFAIPVNNLVRAEVSLKEFIGTLGKTFAQLPIGLAIFDADRRLMLFNPALIDLTTLDAAFLTQRPSLHAFLDGLRERQRIPEPRDYKSWRLRIAQLEADASDGRFQETWSLPTGQTYQVTGQPHPDGAVAFLIEDISTEVSLERQFRSEIDLGLSVFNAMDNGMAVFGCDGTLTFGNTQYRNIWDIDPAQSLSRIGLHDCFRQWGMSDNDAETQARLISFVVHCKNRDPFTYLTTGKDGCVYQVHVRPLPRRASLIEFHKADSNALPTLVPARETA